MPLLVGQPQRSGLPRVQEVAVYRISTPGLDLNI